MSAIFVRKLRLEGLNCVGLYWAEKFIQYYPKSIGLLEDLVMLRYVNGDVKGAYECANNILKLRPKNSDTCDRAIYNKKLVIDKYISEQWSPIRNFPNILPNIKLITLTITCGRRLELFLQTLESFFRCCSDPWLIAKFICVDDNSSKEDRIIMKERWPFLTFINKTEETKGHFSSMQILRDVVDTKYMFHLEDDWLFYNEICLSELLEILDDDNKIGQVLVNRNYTESPSDNIVGGIEKFTQSNLRYFIHEYITSTSENQDFICRYGNVINCNYWPHFSLRPSLINVKIFQDNYFKNVAHFEMDFAKRYVQQGYVSAFLQDSSCKHIGRLTSDRNDIEQLNAYDLLHTRQFDPVKNIDSIVINLDRRKDRLELFNDQLDLIPLPTRVETAIDGNLIKPSYRLTSLFQNNNFNMRRGIVGCALSHIKLWIELSTSNYDGYLIFEDDAVISKKFQLQFMRILTVGKEYGCIFFGSVNSPTNPTTKTGLVKFSKADALKHFQGGTICYYITKEASKKMLDFIDTSGMPNAIDTMIYNAADLINIAFVLPQLVFDPFIESDIQNNYDVSLSVEKPLDNDYKIYNKLGIADLFSYL